MLKGNQQILQYLMVSQLHDVISKKDLPHLINSEGDILIDTEYQNFLKIYTDGSKDPQNNTNG
jgi:hypothetical protein